MPPLVGSEEKIAGNFTFHELALIIAGGSTVFAYIMSFYLIWRHALNYTKPHEQRHIIRILFMVPIYATSAFLCIWYYWHAIYFQVISECYEAFAIASFFALMCHYIAPDLHEQKEYFRLMRPVKPWVWPVTWFAKCCGGDRGPWRTPKSGLTWFNIVWVGIYHYCFIRVAMTITAVVTQYFERYCESSNSPIFAHIWVIAIESLAVTVAMYCVIQFYVQLREPLGDHKPFLKVLAIKLVIFLSFWQSIAISVGTSTLHIVSPNSILAYPDLKVGIPNLLLCVEMALFSILHLWAFPYGPYVEGSKVTFYPSPDPLMGIPARENEHGPKMGGFAGLKAFGHALNVWDIVKAFGRGMRWLFVGVKHRRNDSSYQVKSQDSDTSYPLKSYGPNSTGAKSTDHLPIATEFRRSTFGISSKPMGRIPEESAGLIANAQPDPGSRPQRQPGPYQDTRRQQYYHGIGAPQGYTTYDDARGDLGAAAPQYHAYGANDAYDTHGGSTAEPQYHAYGTSDAHDSHGGSTAGWYNQQVSAPTDPRNSTQVKIGNALWGDRDPQGGPR
ncbi:Uu.00g017550.m01.CDS01 [Anthostomella pinea]|uniref:Uu.00g017550.m01.CDS01 n=1 Tax=Anthostomella pinea TaxID=933095 RepID=A0AAI8VYY9_9PEZI|nr:Uu.00g017550.m01.CDS01 [Anthostomella pinea]